jgi:glycosyltransferase involved in cell wall biosynthesis
MKILYIGNKLMKHGLSATSIETLGPLLEKEGYDVSYSSDKKNQFLRLLDMLWAVFKNRNKVQNVLIDTYSKKSFYGVFFVTQLCRLLGLRYISILRGGNLPLRLKKSPRLSSLIFRNSFQLVAPSGYLKEKFEQQGYRTVVIPNNIPVGEYIFKHRENVTPRLLWVRSFHQIYNPEMAISVLRELKKEYPEAVLCMVGPDKDTSMVSCKRTVAKLGLSDSVTFTGNLKKTQWHKLSENYDIFINTTTVDNTPVSVIEALALGLPVISTNVGGIPFLLKDKSDSILVAPGDVDGMVNAVKQLINDSALTAMLSENGRKKAESFDWGQVKVLWLDLLKQKEKYRSVILYLGNKLSKHGLPVSVIETLGPQLEDLGYKVYYSSEYKNKFFRLIHMLYSVMSKRNIIDKVLMDTYSKYGFWYVYIVARICSRLKIPYYPILHGGKLPLRLQKNPLLSDNVFSNSAVNIAPSDYLKIVFENKGYKVKYIPNNIETKHYRFKERKELTPNILFVRSFNKLYNPAMAIEVFKMIRKEHPEAQLCMVGPASDNDNMLFLCKELVEEYDMQDSVVFTGLLPKSEWHKLSENYDIFINTTNVDNTPVSVIEAMSLGLPVVSTNVGGLPYLIEHEKNGLLVNKGDVDGMANEINRLLSDHELANRLSVNGRRKAELFDWERVKDLWISVL